MARISSKGAFDPEGSLTPAKASGAAAQPDKALAKPRDMSWHDYLINLLHFGSALEHALMVQYLYAAYSLGGEQIPADYRPMILKWQEAILAVAREEMGHLLTVQNVLTLLGAGLTLDRERLPWNVDEFKLEPLTLDSLGSYIYAEMPWHEEFTERPQIEEIELNRLARTNREAALSPRPVGEVYTRIMELLRGEHIPDAAFRDETYSFQASWDDWGRGYRPDPRRLDPEGNLKEMSLQARRAAQFRPHVMIDRVATRTQALAALRALSIQGEGPQGAEGPEKHAEWSHFKRFIHIFNEFKTIEKESWKPTLPVPTNPHTDPHRDPKGYISSRQSRNWADLFNLRYRLLLTYLMHTFQVARVTQPGEPNVRAMLMHKVFGEMYNLKAIAGILVQRPQHDQGDPNTPPRAGPPFELPYNLRVPAADSDCWCLYLDILGTGSGICQTILKGDSRPEELTYLKTLIDLDAQTTSWMSRILTGLNSTERYTS
jgi:hypothetical protein